MSDVSGEGCKVINSEIERLITAQIMKKPELLSLLTVDVKDFGDWKCRDILRAIQDMERDGVTSDLVDIVRYSKSVEASDVATIYSLPVYGQNFESRVAALSDLVTAEKLNRLSGMITSSLSGDNPPSKTVSMIEEYLHSLNSSGEKYQQVTISEGIKDAIDRLQERYKKPGIPGITTGYHHLNSMFGGFEGGKLYYAGARPSQGKTALMLNFAANAISAGASIGIFSIESSTEEISDRILSIHSMVDSLDLKFGKLKASDFNKLGETATYFYEKPMVMYHNPYSTITDIAIQVRRWVRNNNIQILFVDYVQLINPINDIKKMMNHEKVGYNSKQLKALASELKIPIVAVAQMRRSQEGKKPTMADFADSSEIEKDADVAMGIYHESRDGGEEYSCVSVLKARDGRTGDASMRFIREYLKFVEVDDV